MIQAMRQTGDSELSKNYFQFKIHPDTLYILPDHSKQKKINSFLKSLPIRAKNESDNITETLNKRIKESLSSKNYNEIRSGIFFY